MGIGAMLKKNVYLKHYTKNKNDGYNCKYSLCRNYSHHCNVYNSLFTIF